jgi:hypothetical protein
LLGGAGVIAGLMLVRNEADLIATNVRYHLSLGIDHVLVVDNGSSDGTLAILQRLARTGRVHVFSRPGPFLQSPMTSELAREAFLRGADWVMPIDADEFWHVPDGRLADVLDAAEGVGVLETEVVNFVQHRHQHDLTPQGLLTMTRRPPAPVGSSGEADVLVESGRIAFVEICYPPKCISRGSIGLRIAQGNHSATGTYGPARATAALRCLHAPLRARAALQRQKLDPGRPEAEIQDYLRHTWQLRRWRRLADEGALDAEWSANSYLDDALALPGATHPLVIDTTLRDLVAPWIEPEPAHAPAAERQSPPGYDGRSASAEERAAILDRMEQVEGWFRRDEGELLIDTVGQAIAGRPSPAIVEVGSYCGRSTVVLASAAQVVDAGARVYAIDPHEGEVGAGDTIDGVRRESATFTRFEANIAAAGLNRIVVPIRKRSHDVAWQGPPIALLFVDGLHDYESVARDFRHFEPHLAPEARVAFHDCDDNYPGVRAFVAGLAGDPAYEEVARASSLVVLRRRGVSTDDYVAALRARLIQQERGITFLMGEVTAREQTIREREAGIEWLRGVVRDKEESVAELERGIEWLRKELRDREQAIDALRAELQQQRDRG